MNKPLRGLLEKNSKASTSIYSSDSCLSGGGLLLKANQFFYSLSRGSQRQAASSAQPLHWDAVHSASWNLVDEAFPEKAALGLMLRPGQGWDPQRVAELGEPRLSVTQHSSLLLPWRVTSSTVPSHGCPTEVTWEISSLPSSLIMYILDSTQPQNSKGILSIFPLCPFFKSHWWGDPESQTISGKVVQMDRCQDQKGSKDTLYSTEVSLDELTSLKL